MSGMCEGRDCSMCGVESFVARRDEGGRCAECQMVEIADDVVIDALSRAICAVIADAVKDERRGASPKRREYTYEQIQSRIDADIEEFVPCQGPTLPGFVSKNKPAMTSDEAHAAFMIRHGVATPLERHAAHDQFQVQACTKCSADLAYAPPGQTLCYGCRST